MELAIQAAIGIAAVIAIAIVATTALNNIANKNTKWSARADYESVLPIQK